MDRILSILRSIKQSFTVSVVVIIIAFVLSWLGGASVIIAGIPLFDADYNGVYRSLTRAILLIIALGIAPLFMRFGAIFVVGNDRKRSTCVLVWSTLKILIVGFSFFASFTIITIFSGSSLLQKELIIIIGLAIMTNCFVLLILSEIRYVAQNDEIGKAIQFFFNCVFPVVTAFAGGGFRGGIVTIVGISGILSIGLGGSKFVFGLLFLFPSVLTLTNMVSLYVSERLYLKALAWNGNVKSNFLTVPVLIFIVAFTALCSVIALVMAVKVFNGITGNSEIPWCFNAKILFDQPWKQGTNINLIILWAISGVIAVYSALTWNLRNKTRKV